MLVDGARPKETKINLMDCICMCSEVELRLVSPHFVLAEPLERDWVGSAVARKLMLYLLGAILKIL